jgi:hypothetical protein
MADAPARIVNAADPMLPKLRVTLFAVIATCAVGLAIGASLMATRELDKHLAGLPGTSDPLVQQAIVEAPEPQHAQVLAYARRADELARLRDLPVAPARDVIEYAEHARAGAETAPAAPAPASETVAAITVAPLPAAPAAEPVPPLAAAAASIAGVAEAPAPVTAASTPATAAIATPPAPAAPLTETAPAATAPASAAAPAPALAAPTPVVTGAISQLAASPMPEPKAAPADIPATVATPAAVPVSAASGATEVASLRSGIGETLGATVAPTVPVATLHHKAKARVRKESKKKATRVAETRLAPTAKTGFAVELPGTPVPANTSSSQPVPDTRQDPR